MPMQGGFDARQTAPNQEGGNIIPPGIYDFVIKNTTIEATKDGTGGMFVVEIDTPSGSAKRRFNLWNQSAKAVEIAHGQLSALCHAVGIFQINFQDDGAALRGAHGKVKIDYQRGEEPGPEKPHGGYTEIKKFFDVNGNEPGKPPAQNAAPQASQPPLQQGANGAWGNGAPAANPNPTPSQGQQWGAPQGQPANQPSAAPQGQGQPWQPGNAGTANTNPPWGGNK